MPDEPLPKDRIQPSRLPDWLAAQLGRQWKVPPISTQTAGKGPRPRAKLRGFVVGFAALAGVVTVALPAIRYFASAPADPQTPVTNAAPSGQTAPQLADLNATVRPAVFVVKAETTTHMQSHTVINRQSGSGFAFSPDGYILTNAHVVTLKLGRQFQTLSVVNESGASYQANLVATDKNLDLAVLKIDSSAPTPYVRLSTTPPREGDSVLALGSPAGIDMTTYGIITGTNVITDHSFGLLTTDAAINHGNSGGPLFNMRGEVVGINSEFSSYDGHFSGLGGSIPAAVIKSYLSRLTAQNLIPATAMVPAQAPLELPIAVVPSDAAARLPDAIAKAAPAIVQIWGDRSSIGSVAASGSGFIIDPKGEILTSTRALGERGVGDVIPVYSSGAVAMQGTIMAIDEADGIAVLKVDPQTPLPALAFAGPGDIKPGEPVFTFNTSYEFPTMATHGVIEGSHDIGIETSVAVSVHGYGGPLLTLDGRVVGMMNGGIQNTPMTLPSDPSPNLENDNMGVNFATPASRILKALAKLDAAFGGTSLSVHIQTLPGDQALSVPAEIPQGVCGEPDALPALAARAEAAAVGLTAADPDFGFTPLSGFVVDPAGYILTNTSALSSEGVGAGFMARFADGSTYPGYLAAVNPITGLALIKIDAGHDLPSLQLGDDTKAQTGQFVFAISNPLGINPVVTDGILSRQSFKNLNGNLVMSDAPVVNDGGSGAPLLDGCDRVIGVYTSPDNVALMYPVPTDAKMNFFITSDSVKAVLGQLLVQARRNAGPDNKMPGFIDNTP